jgi:hypothetical protein
MNSTCTLHRSFYEHSSSQWLYRRHSQSRNACPRSKHDLGYLSCMQVPSGSITRFRRPCAQLQTSDVVGFRPETRNWGQSGLDHVLKHKAFEILLVPFTAMVCWPISSSNSFHQSDVASYLTNSIGCSPKIFLLPKTKGTVCREQNETLWTKHRIKCGSSLILNGRPSLCVPSDTHGVDLTGNSAIHRRTPPAMLVVWGSCLSKEKMQYIYSIL